MNHFRNVCEGVCYSAAIVALPLLLAHQAEAQESLAGLGTAAAISSGMSATAGLNASRTMQNARQVGAGRRGMGEEPGGGGGGAGGGVAPGVPQPGVTGAAGGGAAGGGDAGVMTTTTTTTRTTTAGLGRPFLWTPGETGETILRKLLSVKTDSRRLVSAPIRIVRPSSIPPEVWARMTALQRKKTVLNRYKIPPRAWLSHYLPQDRYKIIFADWGVVTTPNDPYFYAPNAPAMMRKPPGEIIGFHTWQDAMQAGYRPDPRSKPTPGRQIAHLATLAKGSNLPRYVEFVYAGQVNPRVFDMNYRYAVDVANRVASQRNTKPLVGQTVDQVIGAAIGQGSVPEYVGGSGPPASQEGTGTTPAPVTNKPGPILPNQPGVTGPQQGGRAMNAPGGTEAREEDYSRFKGRAGKLAR